MNYELTGVLVEIFAIQNVTETFNKREFIVESKKQAGEKEFTELVKFQLTNDKCQIIDKFAEGEKVKVFFNIRGRKWKENYFTNLEAWKIEKVGEAAQKSAIAKSQNQALDDQMNAAIDNDTDNSLPF